MASDERFDNVDCMEVMETAVRSYWQSQIDRGHETIPFDVLDPKRQQDIRDQFFAIAPHVIRSLRNAMFNRQTVDIPDVIPDYFFGGTE